MKEEIKKLIELSSKYPEAEIMYFTHYEVCGSDEYSWWIGSVNSVEYVNICEFEDMYDGMILISDSDIKEQLYEQIENSDDDIELSENQINEKVEIIFKEKQEKGEIKKAIVVKIAN